MIPDLASQSQGLRSLLPTAVAAAAAELVAAAAAAAAAGLPAPPPAVTSAAAAAVTAQVAGLAAVAKAAAHAGFPPGVRLVLVEDAVLRFLRKRHTPTTYDRVTVSSGTIEGTVFDMFQVEDFVHCLVSFCDAGAHFGWDKFVTEFASDHMPVCVRWTF